MADSLPLLIFVPFTASLLCLLDRFLPRPYLARPATAASVAVSLLLLGLLLPVLRAQGTLSYAIGGWLEPLGIVLYLDGLAWTASLMGGVVALCALLFAIGEGSYRSDFYFFFLMLMAGMEGVILTGDLFNMFVFIEILSISSYILIAYTSRKGNLWASLRYLMLSSLGVAFFLFGLYIVYRSTGTFSLRLVAEMLDTGGGPKVSSAAGIRLQPLLLAAAALAVGVGLKAAFVPLHTWLPDAHAAAPHPVSALLSGVMIKISFLAMWRILAAFGATGVQRLFLWLGPLSALLGVVLALSQTDSKRLLAFHSVSQMGLIITAYGAAVQAGTAALTASLAHVLSHSLFKSLLFLSVGAVIHLSGERDLARRSRGNPRPWLLAFFLVGAFAISGLPPFNGFVSKTLISSLFKGSPLPGLAIRLTAVGTAASMIKLSGFFLPVRQARRSVSLSATGPAAAGSAAAGDPAADLGLSAAAGREEPQKPRLSIFCVASLALLALLCLIAGLLPGLVLRGLVMPAVRDAAGRAQLAMPGAVYTMRNLLDAGLNAAAGGALYLLVRSRLAGRLTAALRNLRLSLDGALLLVLAVVVLFAFLGGTLFAAAF